MLNRAARFLILFLALPALAACYTMENVKDQAPYLTMERRGDHRQLAECVQGQLAQTAPVYKLVPRASPTLSQIVKDVDGQVFGIISFVKTGPDAVRIEVRSDHFAGGNLLDRDEVAPALAHCTGSG